MSIVIGSMTDVNPRRVCACAHRSFHKAYHDSQSIASTQKPGTEKNSLVERLFTTFKTRCLKKNWQEFITSQMNTGAR
jgi:hypothetical protein